MAISKVLTSDPVVIPSRSTKSRDGASNRTTHTTHKHNNGSREPSRRAQHRAQDLPPAVAALLANTAIPRPRSRPQSVKRNEAYTRLTVDAVLSHNAAKDYPPSLSRTPLDLLLSPPEELDCGGDAEADSNSDSAPPSYLSRTTTSSNSTPSLIASSPGEASPSPLSPPTPTFRARRRAATPRKAERLPMNSPPLESATAHPLLDDINVSSLDFRVFAPLPPSPSPSSSVPQAAPAKSAFKSNLTASLRALRSAAKSISNLAAAPTLRPDDFLTRSIVTLDPRVPFTDERMPPRLGEGEGPSSEMRRYLNPVVDVHPLVQTSVPVRVTASIQLQTYRVAAKARPVVPKRGGLVGRGGEGAAGGGGGGGGLGGRQRDMRENSDFIRVAVMEMLMRRSGKLADNVPGRARWALPPREVVKGEYRVVGGVPVRWIGVCA